MSKSSNPTEQTFAASVIIPVKGTEGLDNCLASLEKQDFDQPYEVIVVDGWYDDAVAAIANKYEHVRLIRSKGNLLQCNARNLGAKDAKADILVFTDSDCVIEPSFISAGVEALNNGARMVGGPVLDARPWNIICVADNFSQFAEFTKYRPNGPAEYFPGCTMAMRKDDFFKAGQFPDTKMTGGEDTILCFEMAKLYPDGLRYVNRMRIRHIGRPNFRRFLDHQIFFGYCRASCGIKMKPSHRELGKHLWIMPALIAKRSWYIFKRSLQWNLPGIPKIILISPLVLLGMVWWCLGFRKGCLEPMRDFSQLNEQAMEPASGV